MTADFLLPIARACQQYMFEQKWLLAPSHRIGNQWKDRLNLRGINTVNLKTATVKSVALRIVSEELLSLDLEFAANDRVVLVVGGVLEKLLEEEKLHYFCDVESIFGLAQLVAKSIGDLRMASVERFEPSSFEDASKATDLRLIVERYEEELARQKLVDYAACLKRAIACVESSQAELPTSLVIVCPLRQEATHLEAELLSALEKRGPWFGPESEEDIGGEFETNFPATFSRTIGEVNEVNLVLQHLLGTSSEHSLDQFEILHTDYSTYVPLIHELLTQHFPAPIDELPVTFGEGLACIYSRPGRAMRSWLRWIRGEYLQTSAVQMVREGLLQFQKDRNGIGFTQLAHRLRELPIGFGAGRYGERIREAITQAELDAAQNSKRLADGTDSGDGSTANYLTADYDFGLAVYEILSSTIPPLIAASPTANANSLELLAAARRFLNQFASCVDKLDQYAREKMLDDISSLERALAVTPDLSVNVWDWLEQLPVDSRIMASGPRPGCLHVEHLLKGGHSGRPNTCLIGLDDSRFPNRWSQDSLLLDFERSNLTSQLPTSTDLIEESAARYRQLLSRLGGVVSFSYSTCSLVTDRAQFPSSALLETYRRVGGQDHVTIDEFEASVGVPHSFCPVDTSSMVDLNQWWFAEMAATPDSKARTHQLENGYAHLRVSQQAIGHRDSAEFTSHDGYVVSAGKYLDPTGASSSRISPTRLETYGACPRKFLFRYGLKIAPPDQHTLDPDQWLTPLTYGTLLHEIFEEFMRSLATRQLIPNQSRDLADLIELLHRKVKELREVIPLPNEDAFRRQLQRLEKTCEIFLRHEESYCKTEDAFPWVFEASLGLGDPPNSPLDCATPIPLRLSDGRLLYVGGRIDRVDRIGAAESLRFAIWDYKSGSDWGFDAANPLNGGRKLQHFLYTGMLQQRVWAAFGLDAHVASFGYFFPSPRTEGLRLRWTPEQLARGDWIVRNTCDAIANGAFLATTDESDCKYCEFVSICGDPKTTARNSLVQLQRCPDEKLNPVRRLRGVEEVLAEKLLMEEERAAEEEPRP